MKIFNRNNPIWHQHNIVITISILALLITLPLTILMVITTERPSDVRSRAAGITGNYGPLPTPTPTTGVAPSCQELLDLATNRWRASCGDENYDPRADVNNDGTINTVDISQINAHLTDEEWCTAKLQDETNPCLETTPTPPSGPMCRADFNHNGDIDIEDLQVFIDDAQADCSIRSPNECLFSDVSAPSFKEANGWQRELWTAVTSICQARVTDGCGNGKYCPDDSTTRAQAAVFILRSFHGGYYIPPEATGDIFNDIGGHQFQAWIEEFFREGFTAGCGNGKYCPDNPMTRAQAAVFLLRARHGPRYSPPEATGDVFSDVAKDHWAAAWIEQLHREGITSGCGNGNYCPGNPTTRAETAVFLSRTLENLYPPVSTCRADLSNQNGDIDIDDLQVLIGNAQDCSIGNPTVPPTYTPVPPTSTPALTPIPTEGPTRSWNLKINALCENGNSLNHEAQVFFKQGTADTISRIPFVEWERSGPFLQNSGIIPITAFRTNNVYLATVKEGWDRNPGGPIIPLTPIQPSHQGYTPIQIGSVQAEGVNVPVFYWNANELEKNSNTLYELSFTAPAEICTNEN